MTFVMTPEGILGDVDVNDDEDMAARVQQYGRLVRPRSAGPDADGFSEGRMLRALEEASGEPVRVVARCRVEGGGFYDWREFRLLSASGLADPFRFPPQRYLLHVVAAEADLMGNPHYGREQLYLVPDTIGQHLDGMGPAPAARVEVVPGHHEQTPREDVLEVLCAHAWFQLGPCLRAVDSVLALRGEVDARRATWELEQLRREERRDAC